MTIPVQHEKSLNTFRYNSINSASVLAALQDKDLELSYPLIFSPHIASHSSSSSEGQSDYRDEAKSQKLKQKPYKQNSFNCRKCGKMYKSKNCLNKHAWEHHEMWEATKRLGLTKHQQVQLLEGAQALYLITKSFKSK
ncbi:hypothetical protein ROZALSC1DRAFT_29815 [Rozella allomycis CSF55]|uniref:C2H2-type domain-containing protein n=1 Tax=Rozella allomycis (strain CSF55) TaxID=988480 RepID=A0A075B0C1_ROZAC|nr:hypothetical protein O9G_000591 [Rozella allomycis CSF55]RKP18512.1 hypothetical protein ROZALSC1DRAFT_29815 [Rozella allomycis CSF55]|eukprot:EPZ34404.1 hypothetical protein O9G_000591 [Rozella allomycis CSF55]